MNTTSLQNAWQVFHSNLDPVIAKKYKAEIECVLNISQSAFYRKLKSSGESLSIADKYAIARVYHINPVYLFPELESESDNKKDNE